MTDEVPMVTKDERIPVPVSEIIAALERERRNDIADALRTLPDWQSRTLMCARDWRPSDHMGLMP